MVTIYGSDFADDLGPVSYQCGISSMACITQSNFCPAIEPLVSISLNVTSGRYSCTYPTTSPGTYSVAAKAGTDYYSGARRALLAAEIPQGSVDLGNSPTSHVATPGEPLASASSMAYPESPQTAGMVRLLLQLFWRGCFEAFQPHPMYVGPPVFLAFCSDRRHRFVLLM